MGASGTSASTLNESANSETTTTVSMAGDTIVVTSSTVTTPSTVASPSPSTAAVPGAGSTMEVSNNIQQLLFSMSPLKIKVKASPRIGTQEQLERLAKFESLGADYIVRYEPCPSDKEACASSKKRVYFPKASLAKTASECRAFYAQLMSACGVDSRKYGFFMSMRRDDLRSSLVLENKSSMATCQFTAACLQESTLLTLKFKPKRASGKVTVDQFESRVATFNTTFSTIFVRVEGVPNTSSLARHYLIRPELAVPLPLHRDLFATCMKHCDLFKAPIFRLQGVSSESLATRKPESGGSGNPLAGLGGGSGGSLGLLSALLSS